MDSKKLVEKLLQEAGMKGKATQTKSGWSLKIGLETIARADNGRLLPLMERHGVPRLYLCVKESTTKNVTNSANVYDMKNPNSCFQCLCGIILGQLVSIQSAQAASKRLVALL